MSDTRKRAAGPSPVHVLAEVGADSAALLFIQELPGCFTSGADLAAARARLPDALTAHAAWLTEIGEPLGRDLLPDPVLGQVIRTGANVGAGQTAAFFEAEREPLAFDEGERIIRLAAATRAALVALVADLPEAALDAATAGGGERSTVRAVLERVARMEAWYATRIDTTEAAAREALARLDDIAAGAVDTFARLAAMRAVSLARFRNLTEEERSVVTEHDGELWSARRALSRFLWHERMQTAVVGRLLESQRAAAGASAAPRL